MIAILYRNMEILRSQFDSIHHGNRLKESQIYPLKKTPLMNMQLGRLEKHYCESYFLQNIRQNTAVFVHKNEISRGRNKLR